MFIEDEVCVGCGRCVRIFLLAFLHYFSAEARHARTECMGNQVRGLDDYEV